MLYPTTFADKSVICSSFLNISRINKDIKLKFFKNINCLFILYIIANTAHNSRSRFWDIEKFLNLQIKCDWFSSSFLNISTTNQNIKFILFQQKIYSIPTWSTFHNNDHSPIYLVMTSTQLYVEISWKFLRVSLVLCVWYIILCNGRW